MQMNQKILKFSAKWCMPCKLLTEAINKEDLGIDIEEVDIDENGSLTKDYNVRSIPTLVYLKDGYEVSRIVGSQTIRDIKKWLEEN